MFDKAREWRVSYGGVRIEDINDSLRAFTWFLFVLVRARNSSHMDGLMGPAVPILVATLHLVLTKSSVFSTSEPLPHSVLVGDCIRDDAFEAAMKLVHAELKLLVPALSGDVEDGPF